MVNFEELYKEAQRELKLLNIDYMFVVKQLNYYLYKAPIETILQKRRQHESN